MRPPWWPFSSMLTWMYIVNLKTAISLKNTTMIWYFYSSLVNVFVPCISGYIANYYRIEIQINPTCRYLCTGGLKGCPRVLVPPPDLETVCSKQFWNLDNQLYRALILKMKKKKNTYIALFSTNINHFLALLIPFSPLYFPPFPEFVH